MRSNQILPVASAVLCMMSSGTPVDAQERISVLLGSWHIDASSDFEDFNPGVFLTWEQERVDWSLGVYRNSFGRVSPAAFGGLPVIRWNDGSVALFAGIAWYPGEIGWNGPESLQFAQGTLVPMLGLRLQHSYFFGQIAPGGPGDLAAIASAGLTFPF